MNFGDFFSFFRSQFLAVATSTSRPCSSLPDDILIEIFAHLPLDSIYKLRCLSKVWLSSLSDPSFITKWLQINKNSLPWIQYRTISNLSNRLTFRNAYPESHSEIMSRNEDLFSFEFLRNQKPFQGARIYLLGSSNGLVLCWSIDYYQKSKYHVCNPLTQKWVSLPSSSSASDIDVSVCGIFCDREYSPSFENCYKVVCIPKFEEPSKKLIVDVFSSDLGVWESFQVSCDENVVWEWSNPNNVVILSGVLYWIEGGNRMLVYNLNQNNGSGGHRCSLIHLPDEEFVDEEESSYFYDFDGYFNNSILGESEGWVCYARARITGGEMTVSVWVLSEVNWQILQNDISVGNMLAELRSRMGEYARIQVLGFSPVDRNVVLLGCHDWVRGFNMQTRNFEELRLDNRHVHYTGGMHFPFVLKPMPTLLPARSWIDT